MKTIHVGLAGFGFSGQIFHAPFIAADDRFELKKCFERTHCKCQEEYPFVENVRSFDGLLTDDIDLVVISLPHPLHVPMARRAIEAGKHVIVEKPVAASSAEAEELCRLAAEKHVICTINQNRRLDGDFLTAKQIIDSGVLGRIVDYRCNYERFVKGANKKAWKAAGGHGIDILYDLGVHIIDQAYYLFGMPQEVYAHMRTLRPESKGVDAVELSLYYPNELVVTLCATETAAIRRPHYYVSGDNGAFAKYGMDVQEEALLSGKRPPADDWGEDLPENYGTLAVLKDGVLEETKVRTVTGNYGQFYDNLYNAIVNGAPLLVKPEEAVDVLRIMEAAQKSSLTKARVRL